MWYQRILKRSHSYCKTSAIRTGLRCECRPAPLGPPADSGIETEQVRQLQRTLYCTPSSLKLDNSTLGMKQRGKPSAGNSHAGFDEAGAGNQLTVRLVRH